MSGTNDIDGSIIWHYVWTYRFKLSTQNFFRRQNGHSFLSRQVKSSLCTHVQFCLAEVVCC